MAHLLPMVTKSRFAVPSVPSEMDIHAPICVSGTANEGIAQELLQPSLISKIGEHSFCSMTESQEEDAS